MAFHDEIVKSIKEVVTGEDENSPDQPLPSVIKDEDLAKDVRRFEEQCFLMDNYELFTTQNESVSYKNFKIIEGQPNLVINKLTRKNGVEKLFALREYQLAALVPTIRLFKTVFPTEDDKEGIEYELYFKDFVDENDLARITPMDRDWETLF